MFGDCLSRKVAMVAGGLTYFSKARKDKTQEELAAEAARMALYENDINLSKDDIDGTVVSTSLTTSKISFSSVQ